MHDDRPADLGAAATSADSRRADSEAVERTLAGTCGHESDFFGSQRTYKEGHGQERCPAHLSIGRRDEGHSPNAACPGEFDIFSAMVEFDSAGKRTFTAMVQSATQRPAIAHFQLPVIASDEAP
ncbi:MAG: hypothetical protein P0119_16130 [Nitrospira sp.]|nr:hypothetical protein [Nitrospira sp.]